jgi:hypothetical protein
MMKTNPISWALASALLAAACGSDDDAFTPDAGSPPVDADLNEPDAQDPELDDHSIVVALGSSDEVGVVSTVGIPSLEVTRDVAQGAADNDAVLRRIDDQIYILNRTLSNLTILDGELQLLEQVSLGAGANPHDVAVRGDSIYVSGFGSEGILVLDATDLGAGVSKVIDLSDLEPETGEPNCSALAVHGDRLLAACQRLDASFAPIGPGVIAVIDTTSDEVETTFELARANPFSRFVPTPAAGPLAGDLLISSVGDFSAASGCIERISLDPEPTSVGCFREGEVLGGYASRLEIDGDRLWFAASREDFSAYVAAYDLSDEELRDPLTAAGHTPTDFALCPGGEIVVADNPFGEARGLRLFAEGDEVTGALLDIGADPAFSGGLVCY